jgi:glycine oxidase
VTSRPDVLVIGAGVIGAAVAWELAAAGAHVRVLDMRRPAAGATQASAGMLAPYIEGHGSEALSTLGQRSLDAYDAFIDRVAADAGRRPLYNREGTLEVARDDAHAARLRASADALAGRVETRWLEGAALAAAEPLLGPGAVGALLVPCHGFVGAADLSEALVAAARAHGAIVHCDSRVHRISDAGGGLIAVASDRETFTAERVVMAAGSWSGQILVDGAAPAPVRPVRGQLLQLALPNQPLPRIVWGADCYLVPWPGGEVLVGATVEDAGFDERTTVAGVAALIEAACALVPALKDAAFTAARVGLRPGGPDDLPIVGTSSVLPGLVYATAHYRNGVLLAPLTAQLVRGLVMNAPADPALGHLSPARAGRL